MAKTCLISPEAPVFVAQQLEKAKGPVVASTDYMKAYAEQIRPFIPKNADGSGRTYKVLGTDGFGRSDFRGKPRCRKTVARRSRPVMASGTVGLPNGIIGSV
jgi:pyruvate dehydrogenase complex dehydrogenase (E1) component